MTNAVSHTTPSRPVPLVRHEAATDNLPVIANAPLPRRDPAAEIAAEQVRRIDELSLIGYPALDPATRSVYETALRLGAERVLEA